MGISIAMSIGDIRGEKKVSYSGFERETSV
jgi:hypothetical protein